jgi:hypothetical protein
MGGAGGACVTTAGGDIGVRIGIDSGRVEVPRPADDPPPAQPPEMLAMKPVAGTPPVLVPFMEARDVTVSPVGDLMSMPASFPMFSPLCRQAARRPRGTEKHHHGNGGDEAEVP